MVAKATLRSAALDAIHIGTAAVVGRTQRRRGNRLRVCTADHRQADAAVARFGTNDVVLLGGLLNGRADCAPAPGGVGRRWN